MRRGAFTKDVELQTGEFLVVEFEDALGRTRRVPVPSVVDAGTTDLGTVEIEPGRTLYTISMDGPFLRSVDFNDLGTSRTVARIALTGHEVDRGAGLAQNPLDGSIYAVLRTRAGLTLLAVVVPRTGQATLVGDLGDWFEGIAFLSDGTLYGVTGDRASSPESLFLIDRSDATTTLVRTLGNGGFGDSIGFHPGNGLLYHASGEGNELSFGTIDPAVPGTFVDVALRQSQPFGGLKALTYSPDDDVLFCSSFQRIVEVAPNGKAFELGSLDHRPAGIVLVPTLTLQDHRDGAPSRRRSPRGRSDGRQ